MKRILIVIITIIIIGLPVRAQNKVGIFFNQNYSTFRFVDSEKKVNDLDYIIKFGYGATFQISITENLFIEGSLAYNNKGATSENDQEKLDWSFHYFNIGSNAGYKLIFGRLHPQGGAGLYYGRLLRADQMIGSEYYDLKSSGIISKNDFGFNLFAGLDYKYSDAGFVFLRLNESMGLLQLEKESESDQRMFNRTFSLQVGLLFIVK